MHRSTSSTARQAAVRPTAHRSPVSDFALATGRPTAHRSPVSDFALATGRPAAHGSAVSDIALATVRSAAHRSSFIAFAFAAVLATALLSLACGQSGPAAPGAGKPDSGAAASPAAGKPGGAPGARGGATRGPQGPAPVLVGKTELRNIPIVENAVGAVEANATVQVKAMIGGILNEVHFKEGELVKKGEELFSIDPRPFQAALHKQEAAVAKDEAQARYTDADARRYVTLIKASAASQEDADRARATADSAAAQVQADHADLDAARLQLEYCSIKAPFDGRAGDILVDAGNIVKANDVPLVTIHQTHPIVVSFTLPEADLPTVLKARNASATPLRVQVAAPGDLTPPVQGDLTFIDNEVDRQTGTIRFQATFDNDDDRLWPGLFVNVSLVLGEQDNVLVVPTEAIQNGQQGYYVYVAQDDNTVVNRSVKPGRAVDGHTAIVEGLKEGERVVTDGHLRLKPGAKIEVKSSLDAAALAAAGAPAAQTPAGGDPGGKPRAAASSSTATLARTDGQ
jgi:multidrug efflux system membrane fusion protein